jgi:hypothetical protein
MSGAIKHAKKRFKQTNKLVKKLWKNPIVRAIVIAVVIYFTAGLAAGAMGTTATAGAVGGAEAAAGAWVASDTGMMVLAAEANTAAGAMSAIEAAGGVVQLAGEGALASGVASETAAVGLSATGESVIANAAGEVMSLEGAAGQAFAQQQGGLIGPGQSGGQGLINSNLAAEGQALVSEPPVTPEGAGAQTSAPTEATNIGRVNVPENLPTNGANPGASESMWDTVGKKFGFTGSEVKSMAIKGGTGAVQGGLQMWQAAQAEDEAEQAARDRRLRQGYAPDISDWRFTPKVAGMGIVEDQLRRG